MQIVQLTAENVKRLSAVQITPKGNVVVIAGQNDAGKTSVLDAIMYGLAGGGSLPSMPVRRGQKKARVELDLGELVVKRTFTESGGTALVVSNKNGLRYPSPQAILDALVGRLTFDPLAFSRQAPKEQAATLQQLVGLDFTKQEEEHRQLFFERQNENRSLKQLEARLALLPVPEPGLPAGEQSVENVMAEMEEASKKNQANEERRQLLLRCEARMKDLVTQIDAKTLEAERIEKEIQVLEAQLQEQRVAFDNIKTELVGLQDVDLTPFRQRAADVQAVNVKIRAANERATVQQSILKQKAVTDGLTKKMEKLTKDREEATKKAKFPVKGLAFTAEGVTLEGIPFDQCSASQQLKVSVAIGLALNPKLKVLLCRDASLLDEKNLALLAQMADEAKAQVWIERVGEGDAVSVVIEDGHVKGQAPAFQPEMPVPTQDPGPPPAPPQKGAWQAPSEPPPEELPEVPTP